MRFKTALQLASLLLLLLAGGMLLWAFSASVSLPAPDVAAGRGPLRQTRQDALPQDRGLASQWDKLFAVRFQRPLYDPPPEAPPPVVKKEIPPPPIQVIATIPEAGGGSAIIQDDKGRMTSYAVGATITAGGTQATLLRVHSDRVELQHGPRVITIPLKVN